MDKQQHRSEPYRIGWNEFVDIPEWGIKGVRAKVDTGAKSSALHVENIVRLPRERVRFDVVLHRHERDRRVHVQTRIRREGRVRSSNGDFEQRIFVTARVHLGPIEKEVELSLVDRGKMIHRMLLGRSALAGDFLIDVSQRCLLTKKRKKKRKKKTRSAPSSGPATHGRPGKSGKLVNR